MGVHSSAHRNNRPEEGFSCYLEHPAMIGASQPRSLRAPLPPAEQPCPLPSFRIPLSLRSDPVTEHILRPPWCSGGLSSPGWGGLVLL